LEIDGTGHQDVLVQGIVVRGAELDPAPRAVGYHIGTEHVAGAGVQRYAHGAVGDDVAVYDVTGRLVEGQASVAVGEGVVVEHAIGAYDRPHSLRVTSREE